MAVFKGFPIIDQKTAKDVNRLLDCVVASVVACIIYHYPELANTVTVAAMKDAVLGVNYQGMTDALWFVKYAAKYGVKLSSIQVESFNQPRVGHQYVQQDIPVIATEADPWCSAYQRDTLHWTHAVTWCGDIPNGLPAMDSYAAAFVDKTDAQWASSLRGNVLWLATKISPPIVAVQQPQEVIPQGWRLSPDGKQLIDPVTGFTASDGFKAHITNPANKWSPDNRLKSNAYGTGVEGNTRQDCLYCGLEWNSKDGVTLSTPENYLMYLWSIIDHLDTLKVHDEAMIAHLNEQMMKVPDTSVLQGQLAAYQQKYNELLSTEQAANDHIAELLSANAELAKTNQDMTAQVKELQGQVDAKTGVTQLLQALKPFEEAIHNAV